MIEAYKLGDAIAVSKPLGRFTPLVRSDGHSFSPGVRYDGDSYHYTQWSTTRKYQSFAETADYAQYAAEVASQMPQRTTDAFHDPNIFSAAKTLQALREATKCTT